MTDAIWRWAISGSQGTWSSLQADNPDQGVDHLVTYKVEGLDSEAAADWLLFWDDTPGAVQPPNPVPLPPAVALGVAGLIGVIVLRPRFAG